MEVNLYVIFVGIPSAVFYGLIFLVVRYLLLLKVPGGRGILLSALLIVTAAFVLPIYGNRVTEREFRAARSLDTLPAQPIQLTGDIRIEDRNAYARACSQICRSLLNTPGITSVTVYSNPRESFTHGIVDGDACLNATAENRDRNRDPFTARLAKANKCVLAGPPIDRFDFRLVTSGSRSAPIARSTGQGDVETRLLPRPPFIDRFEILDRSGKTLLRSTSANMRSVRQPLLVNWSLARHPPHIGFWAETQSVRHTNFRFNADAGQLLARYTNFVAIDDR